MSKITFIGAGSMVFTRNLCSDVLFVPALQDSTIALMDIDPVRLEQSRKVVQAIIDLSWAACADRGDDGSTCRHQGRRLCRDYVSAGRLGCLPA